MEKEEGPMDEERLSGIDTRGAFGRRTFLLAAGASAFFVTVGRFVGAGRASPSDLDLPPLPYPEDALQPFISRTQIGFHYGKHHKGYVDNLKKLVAGTEYAQMSLEYMIRETAGRSDKATVFNNAAQIWNHTFYWRSIKPGGGGDPPAALKDGLVATFGTVEACKRELHAAGMAVFGSGWVWLVRDGGKLKVTTTPNAEVPFVKGMKPLLTIDVWEHAYYLDYQNRRGDYLTAVLDSLLNWDYALSNLST